MRKNKRRTEKARRCHYPKEEDQYKGDDTVSKQTKISSEAIVTASYFTGTPFKALTDACKICGVKTESLRKCYTVQKASAPKIIEKANECIRSAQQSFSGEMQIDTRWSHRRNASQGLTTAFDPVSRKVVGRSHQVRFGGNRFSPNCQVPSNMMESLGSTEVLQEFKDRGLLDQIKAVTRDRDNKSETIFATFGIADKQRHDPGHFRKNFRTLWNAFTTNAQKPGVEMPKGGAKAIERPFFGLATPLEKWLNYCFTEKNDEKRVQMWLNSAEHFTGNHTKCNHPADIDCFVWKKGLEFPSLKRQFENFLSETAPIVQRTSNDANTQSVESMNSEYGRICSKNLSWKYAQSRLDTAIIKHNEPEKALEIIADCCGAQIPQETLDFFQKQAETDESRNEIRRTQEARCKKKLLKSFSITQNHASYGLVNETAQIF